MREVQEGHSRGVGGSVRETINYIKTSMLSKTSDLIIANNCCGGVFYQHKGFLYNNPFIWMIVPYDSMAVLMTQFEHIKWNNIKMFPSKIKKNTFIINVDNKVDIHYVHYIFDPKYISPTIIVDSFGKHLASKNIWIYMVNKYIQRVNEMYHSKMIPKFIIHDQVWGVSKNTIEDLVAIKCKYKRVFITSECIKCNYDAQQTKVINSNPRMSPIPMMTKWFDDINNFLSDG